MSEPPAAPVFPASEPLVVATPPLLEKNRWLIRIRWIYAAFVVVFFAVYQLLFRSAVFFHGLILLVLTLPILENLMFALDLRRRVVRGGEALSPEGLRRSATLQLDVDLIVLSLLVFFSGGLDSPILVLYVFFIMVSTFVIDYQKAFRNTITSIVLLLAIFLSQQRDLEMFDQRVTTMVAFDFMLIFAFTISGYLAKNLRRNEDLMAELLAKTHELSISDGLTGLYNQAHFFELLAAETQKSERYNFIYSLVIFDVDNFKNYNDHNGHLRGSETLKRVGALMRLSFRGSDILAKYGGDEFIILLPQTDKIGSFLAAERLREAIEREKFPGGEWQPRGKVTISIGIASFPEHATTGEGAIEKADRALYRSKESGRNRTTIYSPQPDEDLIEG
ncbi:MAG TPA: GGDEF domain-containing protein [Candidatus Aminicenantes bacterium]|nr:GGDEF domain-containing protein [Candidatus Aminicenantes bacterium]